MQTRVLKRLVAVLLISCLFFESAEARAYALPPVRSVAVQSVPMPSIFASQTLGPVALFERLSYEVWNSSLVRRLGDRYPQLGIHPDLELTTNLPPEIDSGQSWVVVTDINGTLLEPNWRDQYATAYRMLIPKAWTLTAYWWVGQNTIGEKESVVVERLMNVSGQTETAVKQALASAKTAWGSVKMPKKLKKADRMVRALHDHGIPMIATSNSRLGRTVITQQLRRAGLLQWIGEENVWGIDEMGSLLPEGGHDRHLARELLIREIQRRYPGRRILYLNDASEGFRVVHELGGVGLGLATNRGVGWAIDRTKLVNAGAHYIVSSWAAWREIFTILAMVGTELPANPTAVQQTISSEGTKRGRVTLSEREAA